MKDKFETIKKYKKLLDAGVLTEQEFDEKKQELLFPESAVKEEESFNGIDKFEAIKKYKAMLDSEEITREFFDKKKQELLFGGNAGTRSDDDGITGASGDVYSAEDPLPSSGIGRVLPVEKEDPAARAELAHGNSEPSSTKMQKRGTNSSKKKILIPIIIAAAAAATVVALFFTGVISFGGHVSQKITEVEAGESYTIDDLFEVDAGYTITTTDLYTSKANIFYLGELKLGELKEGESNLYPKDEQTKKVKVSVVSKSGAESTKEFTFKIVDSKAPEISVLNGVIELNSTPDYGDMFGIEDSSLDCGGLKLSADLFEKGFGGKVDIDSSSVDVSTAGDYTVTVKATDAFGNSAEKAFLVQVKEKNEARTAVTVSNDRIVGASASSTLKESTDNYGTYTYVPEHALDGNTSTAWSEGVDGLGEGETLTLTFDSQCIITGMEILNGYQKNEDIYYRNARPSKIQVTFSDGQSEIVNLNDVMGWQTVNFSSAHVSDKMVITIMDAYPGTQYEDTNITEIELF